MAEQEGGPMTNGSGENGAMEETGPQVSVLAQYVKDLSVENPSAPQVFQWQDAPQLDVGFNIVLNQASDEVHEVSLKIEVSAKSGQGTHFIVDLTYAGLFGIRNVPQDAMGPFLLIEAPRLIFPFARQVVADAVSGMGFPPLLLEPVDFASAYVARVQEEQQNAGGAAAPAETPTEA